VSKCACSLSHTAKKDLESPNEEWGVDQQLISKLKEKYKNERKGKKTSKSPNVYPRLVYHNQTTRSDIASLLLRVSSSVLLFIFYQSCRAYYTLFYLLLPYSVCFAG